MPRPNKFLLPDSINKWTIFHLAADAKVDPRTLIDYLTGRRQCRSETTRTAIAVALKAHGHADLIRTEA